MNKTQKLDALITVEQYFVVWSGKNRLNVRRMADGGLVSRNQWML
jgi:hypothetical protein